MVADELQQWAALLSWLEAAGVDAAVGDDACDWTRTAAAAGGPASRETAVIPHESLSVARPVAGPSNAGQPVPAGNPASAPGRAGRAPETALPAGGTRRPAAPANTRIGEAAVGDARMEAASAATLEELRAALERFEGCALKATASRLVFADGDPAAPVMAIGEAPGGDEDRTGVPFVGRAGQLLDRMLATVGLDRRLVYITNIVTWRPPGNRKPNAGETAVCLPFCHRHITLKQPKAILLLGGTAAAALAGTTESITRLRGRWLDLPVPGLADPVPALPVFHPAYLLRTPAAKRQAWRDLRALARRLDALGVARNPVPWGSER